jgi:glycosyltransferase involved in cell wall biosynthesis
LNLKPSPVVSIIIPTFNHANFLGRALGSLLDQTYSNWEALIIDNQSIDETAKVVKKFLEPRIKYLKISNKGIIAKSRNLGIKMSKGEWIAFLDSDDWWTKDKLEFCFNNINNKIDFIYHDLEVVHHQSTPYFKKKNIGRQLKKPILKDLLVSGITKGSAIGNSSVVVRKSILTQIGGISENKDLVASEDYNTWLRIAKITNRFKYLNRTLGFYLIHDKSVQKKNLSIPHRKSVEKFMKILNVRQKLDLEVKLRYMSANYEFSKKNYSKAIKDFIFVFYKGNINFKLRSLLKIILIKFS